MTSRKRPREGTFRVLRGLNFQRNGEPVRIEAGEIVSAADLPRHGTGQCEISCNRPGAHDWMIRGATTDGDPVIEVYPPPPPGALSVAPAEGGELSVATDTAGAVSDAGPAPAEE